MKLDIGSGPVSFEDGWTSVDLIAGADVQADMAGLPFEDETVEAIWSSHALEHQARALIVPTLREWFRVLQHGGGLTIQVPNMDWVAAIWLHGGDRTYAQHVAFGEQAHEGDFHKSGWRLPDLRADLEEAGFALTTIGIVWTTAYSQESIRAEAVKP